MTRNVSNAIWDNSGKVDSFLDRLFDQSPNVFPEPITDGYQLADRLPDSVSTGRVPLTALMISRAIVAT